MESHTSPRSEEKLLKKINETREIIFILKKKKIIWFIYVYMFVSENRKNDTT